MSTGDAAIVTPEAQKPVKKRRAAKRTAPAPADTAPAAEAAAVEPATDAAAAGAQASVQLEGSLQIKDVEAARDRLMPALAAAAVLIDLRQLGPIDTAGVQLLLSFLKTAAARGIAVQLRGAPAAFAQALAALGLQQAFAVTAA